MPGLHNQPGKAVIPSASDYKSKFKQAAYVAVDPVSYPSITI